MNVEAVAVPLNFILRRVSSHTLSVMKTTGNIIGTEEYLGTKDKEMGSILKLKPLFLQAKTLGLA